MLGGREEAERSAFLYCLFLVVEADGLDEIFLGWRCVLPTKRLIQ